MAGSRLFNALSFLSLASAAIAAPSVSTGPSSNTTTTSSSGNICDGGPSKCVPFTIDLTWGTANPTNGYARNVILTNGSFPGPALKLKEGECVDFTVINNMDKVTGVHFHGIQQTGTPWADGVPGLSQYSIKPGTSYMYRWTADEQGVYFYHAHYKGQMMDGLYGAIIISPKDGSDKPFGLISNDTKAVQQMNKAEANVEPIFISDWVQYTFDEFYQIQENANIDYACMDSIILNGMGSVYCLSPAQIAANQAPQIPKLLNNGSLTAKGCLPANTAATQGNYTRNLAAIPPNAYDVCTPASNKNYTYKVDPADGWAAISLINPGGFALLKATIDNHKLYVFEVNGHYVTPQSVDVVNVGNGERVTFLVKLDQQVGDYQIRIANAGLNQVISGYGVLSYKGSSGISSTSQPVMSYGGANITAVTTLIPPKMAPYPAVPVPAAAASAYKFDLMKQANQPKGYVWTFSGVNPYDMSRDDQAPLLFQDPNTIQASDTIIKTQANQVVDLIVRVQGPLAQPHPVHKHGNKFWVLGSGIGEFPYASVAEAQAAGLQFNLATPPYVDGYTTTPSENSSTWMALRYKTDHPGAWFLHCHMQSHFSGGMAVAILDGVDQFPKVPADVGKVCPGNGVSSSPWTGSGSSNATVPGNGGSGSGSGSSGTATGSGPKSTYTGVAPYTGAASTASGSALITLMAVFAAALSL